VSLVLSSIRRLISVREGVLFDTRRPVELVHLEEGRFFGIGFKFGIVIRICGVFSSGSRG